MFDLERISPVLDLQVELCVDLWISEILAHIGK